MANNFTEILQMALIIVLNLTILAEQMNFVTR